MQKSLVRTGLVFGIIILFIGAGVTPSMSGNVSKMNDIKDVEARTINDAIQTNEGEPYTVSTVDWWPMFHHDLSHSGYSTSDAPDTNNVKWSYSMGMVYCSPAVANGKVYIGSMDHNVYCLDANTGTKIWNYLTGNSIAFSSPAVANGKVYIGSMDHNVYCLDANTGTKIWNYLTGSSIIASSPAVADGKVYIGSGDHNVYCLDANAGSKIWSFLTKGSVKSSPAIANGKIYVGSFDDSIYCLDADTGEKIWNYSIYGSSPAVVNGKVYMGSYADGKVYCLDANTGNKIWTYQTGGVITSSPAVADGKVYIGSPDWNVYCLDANTGSKIWNYQTNRGVDSSPAVADGKVYVGSDDDNVYCLDANTGSKIWSYTTGYSVRSSPAVANGKVCIGSPDGNVYCFGDEGPQPFYFVHITDPHVIAFGTDRWDAVRNEILSWSDKPEFVLCTGDLVDWGAGVSGHANFWAFVWNLHWTLPENWYLDSEHEIPICFCPGNHDSRYIYQAAPPYSLINYNLIVNMLLYYYTIIGNCAIFSLNSGNDCWPWGGFPWPNPFPWDAPGDIMLPEGEGLYSLDVLALIYNLDSLDGSMNGVDTSDYVKIIMLHHPHVNSNATSGDSEDGVFWNFRDEFKQICNQFGVHLVLCGHLHGKISGGRVWDLNGGYWSPEDGTKCIVTAAVKDYAHRNISIDLIPTLTGNEYEIIEGDMEYVKSTINLDIRGRFNACIYNDKGNYTGVNETGDGIYLEIPGSFYSRWIFDNETLGINETYIEISVDREYSSGRDDSSDYMFVIEGLADDTMNLTVEVHLKDDNSSKAIYENVTLFNGSVATLYANNSIVNYTVIINDPDGTTRELQPTNYTGNLPPEKPSSPSGLTSGNAGEEYTYETSTIDADYGNQQIYYLWDWGDDTFSDWLGPYDSGETAEASHTWTEQDTYEIKVKAKDIYDCESAWSDPLPVTMPRNRIINRPFFNFLQNHPNLFPILQRLLNL